MSFTPLMENDTPNTSGYRVMSFLRGNVIWLVNLHFKTGFHWSQQSKEGATRNFQPMIVMHPDCVLFRMGLCGNGSKFWLLWKDSWPTPFVKMVDVRAHRPR